MEPATPRQEEELFAAALNRPAPERDAFLEGACNGDAALRARILGLIPAHDGSESVMVSAPTRPVFATDEKAGDWIARYKLLQKIGEGGCGVVWMTEQEEPVRRRVALKVIKLGMDTKSVVARFEAERQALAMMDHPSVLVVGAGADEPERRCRARGREKTRRRDRPLQAQRARRAARRKREATHRTPTFRDCSPKS